MDKERFIEKAKIIFGDAYDYGKVPNEFKSNSSVKVEIICPKHGSFFKSYGNHIIKKQGCPECAKKDKKLKLSNDEFINRLKSIYNSNDYSFDKVNYTGINNNIIITCKNMEILKFPQKAHCTRELNVNSAKIKSFLRKHL